MNWEAYEGFLPLALVLLYLFGPAIVLPLLTRDCRWCHGTKRCPAERDGKAYDTICWHCFAGLELRWPR